MTSTDTSWTHRYQHTDFKVQNFIEGAYQPPSTGAGLIDKHSPRDGHLLYQFGEGSVTDVDQAVTSAKAAFEQGEWSQKPLAEKKAILSQLLALIQQYHETFALYECVDVGKPISKALTQDIGATVGYLQQHIEMAGQLTGPCGHDVGHFAYHHRKPVGVVAGICGWNFPLALAMMKVAPALLMGNSLVLKPSEFTSLSTSLLAELAVEAGVPKGVFNVVHGAGVTVGGALARHNDVDLLSFVGSTSTGKALMKAAGESNMKRLILECGGKSPFIVFDDCPDDLNALADHIVALAFPNQGALCVAGTRLLVQDTIREQLLPLVIEKARAITPADPLDKSCGFGALVNEGHMNKVLSYIESGKAEGAELITGGERFLPDSPALQHGYYIAPTIFDHVDPQSRIAQEEIFGPLLSILSFKDEQEAIALANNTCFGLAAYAATENAGRAQRLGQQLKAGILTLRTTNTPGVGNVTLSSDKQGQSGFGFSDGLEGLAAHSLTTTVHMLCD